MVFVNNNMKIFTIIVLMLMVLQNARTQIISEDKSKAVVLPELKSIKKSIRYNEVKVINDILRAVKLNDKWGLIDTICKEVTPLKYDYVTYFSNGSAQVVLNDKYFYINHKGECVKDCENAPADHPRAK